MTKNFTIVKKYFREEVNFSQQVIYFDSIYVMKTEKILFESSFCSQFKKTKQMDDCCYFC